MRWALRRQVVFALCGLGVVVFVALFVYGTYFYKTPTCFDGVQNQDEEGIDCNGSCALLCSAPNIGVVWARPVQSASGVYHAVALIRNPDTTAGGNVLYEVSFFDSSNILIARRPGQLTLAPGEIAPLFEANIATGERIPVRAFVDVMPGMFKKMERLEQQVRVVNWDLDETSLRLTATVQNYTTRIASETAVTALLFNQQDVLVSASQTFVGTLAPGERKTILFTWQKKFAEPISRIDLIPRAVETE